MTTSDSAAPNEQFPPVFVVGRITPSIPSLAIEKELVQTTGRADMAGLTDRQALKTALADANNRYLARELCWVLSVQGLDTYILVPREPAGLDLLLDALRPTPTGTELDVVVGVRGPLASAEMCNGLILPIVVFDQLYSFDRDSLVRALPRPEGVAARQEEQFRASAAELFDRLIQLTDNAGAADEHRAINYVAVRYQAPYGQATEMHGRNFALTAVEARPSRLSGTRNVIDVIFSYTHRQTDVVEKYFTRVDVTEKYPFLVTRLSPYYDRT